MSMTEKRIPGEIFKQILEHAPMVCVDLVVLHKGKVLMVFREREPVKHTWFFPGGRIFKNERLEEAVKRKAREELGIEVRILRKVGVYETVFEKSPVEGVETGTHTINCVFVVEPVDENPEIVVDNDHSDFKWIDKTEEEFCPYLKQVLKDSGVFG